MHRSNGEPDWLTIQPKDRNFWQNIAASTRGIITPGNYFTVAGLAIVVLGLSWLIAERYWAAIAALAVGRSFDLLDGWAAESTGTKSPLGELFDAASDKLGTFLTLGAAAFAAIAPWWLLLALTLPHIIIAAISYAADRRGQRLHPSRLGKLSMAAAWAGILGLIILKAVSTDNAVAIMPVYLICGISIGMGVAAASRYLKSSSR